MAIEDEDILLAKWLEGSLSEDEQTLLSSSYDLTALKEVLARQENYEIDAKPSAQLWDEFIVKMRYSQNDHTSAHLPNSMRRWWIIGALMALALLILWIISMYDTSDNIIKSKPGETIQYALPGGSTIDLSPGSSIDVDTADWANQRSVTLSGQAYFKVTKGVPFEVRTTSGVVKVLGTSFDIWSHSDNGMTVSCEEGKVSVSNQSADTHIITALQRVEINDGELSEVQNSTNQSDNWRSGKKKYYRSKVAWVKDDIERFYDVRVNIPSELTEKRFSGVIHTTDLVKALELLTKSMGWIYVIDQKNITILKG